MEDQLIKQVLLKQFGAVKPPWIHIDDFYRLPFNYCDHWCERCKLSKICRVYQIELQRNKKYIKKGIDPRSWEVAFQVMRENFSETRKLLEKMMKQFKITEEEMLESEIQYESDHTRVENDDLYRLSYKLMFKLVKYLEDLQYYLSGRKQKRIKESYTILGYYCHIFPAKIFRAILSGIEDVRDHDYTSYDNINSAFLAYLAILKIIHALENMSEIILNRTLSTNALKLSFLLDSLNEALLERFKLESIFFQQSKG